MHDPAALLGPTRTASVPALCRDVDPRTIRRWLAAGRLVRLHPGWVTLPELADDWTVRAHAATGYTGGTLSHMSALAVHRLVANEVTRLDVTVPVGNRVECSRWLRVHRSRRPCAVTTARGLPATSVARSLVDTWGDAHRARATRGYADVARNAVLGAARNGRVTATQVAAELPAVPRLPGRAALVELLRLVAAGAQSHLEILGLRALAGAPGLPPPHLQYRVVLPDGPVRLDAAWPDVKLAVEFDGAAFHAGPEAWQRDLRRNAALAALGWVVLRFSYADVSERSAVFVAQVVRVHRQRSIDAATPDIPAAVVSAWAASMPVPGTR